MIETDRQSGSSLILRVPAAIDRMFVTHQQALDDALFAQIVPMNSQPVNEEPASATNADDGFQPHPSYREYPPDEMLTRATAFADEMNRRRTTRHFSNRPVAREVIEQCIRAAGTAPSGAHQQPWHFVVVSEPELKTKLREAAEVEEREFYSTAPPEWLAALAPLGTDANKDYLEIAPYIIAVFAKRYGLTDDGSRQMHYYVNESVGIASGLLLAALHSAGLVTLTHTPSPMGFLRDLLGRPENEKAIMLVVAGYPAQDARVPRLTRKPLPDIATFR